MDTSDTGAMDVDTEVAIRNPKAENYIPKIPSAAKMGKGRRSEIEAWIDFLELFLSWVSLFDDRIPGEIHKAMASATTVDNRALNRNEAIRSSWVYLYIKQAFAGYARGLDILKQVEKEQLGVSAGYEAMRRLHLELSVGSRIEASTLREEVMQRRPSVSKDRPLDMFRALQVEFARYSRLTASFSDLALSEADKCMIVLKNLSFEVKRYILLQAKIDNLGELETALRFYDSNLKVPARARTRARPGLLAEPCCLSHS